LTGLVKKIDDATVQNRPAKMGSFVVMLSDDDKLEGKLKELAEKEKLQKIVLTIDNPSGPPGYDIQKDSEVTVVLYVKRKIVKTFAFAKDKLTEKDVASIIDALPEILPAK